MNPPPVPQGTVAQNAVAPVQQMQAPARFSGGGYTGSGYTGPFYTGTYGSNAVNYAPHGGFSWNGPDFSKLFPRIGTWAERDIDARIAAENARPYRLEGTNVFPRDSAGVEAAVPDQVPVIRLPNALGGGAGAGIAAAKFPKLDISDLPSRDPSDEKLETLKKRLEAQYGPGKAAEIIADIKRQKGEVEGRAKRDKDEAIIKAGLAMMAGRSQYGLQNIAVGANTGLEAYQTARKERDNEIRALSQQEREAMLQQERRQDAVTSQILDHEERLRTRTAQERRDMYNERLGTYNANADAVKFGEQVRQFGAHHAQVERQIQAQAERGVLDHTMQRVQGAINNARAAADKMLATEESVLKQKLLVEMDPAKQQKLQEEYLRRYNTTVDFLLAQTPGYAEMVKRIELGPQGIAAGRAPGGTISFTSLPR